jgi:hypothetical protein
MERIACESCGAEVFDAASVTETRDDGVHRFCSVRCANLGGVAERLAPAALAKRIVVAIDGSGPSLRALEIAAGIAKASGGTITLVHAIDVRGVRALKTLESAPDFLGRLRSSRRCGRMPRPRSYRLAGSWSEPASRRPSGSKSARRSTSSPTRRRTPTWSCSAAAAWGRCRARCSAACRIA